INVRAGELFMRGFRLFFVLLEVFFAIFLFLGKNSLKQTKKKELV
ncbi:TIGR01906 family membrane protein, partial [Enterococcus faecium]|nr:TIGR01906 family membrane protein [Enterococcus faecium]